ncbi:MAG: hypothetical protein AAFV88_02800 [Planctomycetota bacterium]
MNRQLIVPAFGFFVFLLSAAWPSISAAEDSDVPAVSCTVDLAQAANHYIHVTVEATAEGESTEVMMPVWTPGSYLVREYARHIDHFEVVGADDQPLPFQKTRKNRWTIETKPGETFRVRYRLYCNEVSVRTNFTNHYYAVLNGAPTFVTPADQLDREHHVHLKLPAGWQRSACSLASDQPHHFVAKNFDQLVDSPIAAGQIEVFPFEVEGVPHQLVQVGDGAGYWDGTKAANDLQKIVAQQAAFWGQIPYDHYLFLNIVGEGGGGLEHDYSCLMLTSRWAFRDPAAYENWLSLASHELFHAWNVRRLRPQPLRQYNYERETYTDSLWVAEGITSYFEDIFLVRAGLIDEKAFLKRFSTSIERIETENGQQVQSLRDASFDTWIKFYRPDENSSNTRVSYYSKGAVVAFLLDAEIQAATDGERSLADVLKLLYEEQLETGYSEAEFRSAASEVAGIDLEGWFTNAVDSTDPLDYQPAMDWYGLQLGEVTGDATKEEGEKDDDGESTEPKKSKDTPWLGVTLREATISKLTENAPGFQAGLVTDDEILAINGFRLRTPLSKHLAQFQVGDHIEILLDRKGELLKRTATLGKKPTQSWKLKSAAKPSDDQKSHRKNWLSAIEP